MPGRGDSHDSRFPIMTRHMTMRQTSLLLAMLCSVLLGTTGYADSETAVLKPDPAQDRFNPAVAEKLVRQHGIDRIVFIKRATMQSSHYYTDFIDGCRFFGTDLCILDLKTGRVTSILPERLRSGIINRMDVSFDGTRIVFDWKPDNQSGFHIWEVGADGKGLRQITFPPADDQAISKKYHLFQDRPYHWVKNPYRYPVDFGVYGHWTDDMHPCYLPDGGIAFISTRCHYGILCDGADVLTTTVLYRIDTDGSNMQKLSNSSVSEANPTVSEDGRILYTRWEYIDKGASCVKCVWSMSPQGTGSAEVYGNDLAMPPSIIHTRQVPGFPHLYVATAAPHCPNTGVGSIIMLDTSKGIRSAGAMENLTPETEVLAEGWFKHPWMEGASREAQSQMQMNGPHFADPYPLDDQTLLMACQPDRDSIWLKPDGYGIYVYEGPGQYTRLYDAGGISCWGPQPLRDRPLPAVSTSPVDVAVAQQTLAGHPLAVCVVTDVYQGLTGIERGQVKYIRINEQVPRPWSARRTWASGIDSFDQQHSAVGATHLGLKAQWGIVPVEQDGSAHFYVPADRNVFFQVLDEDFRELQRERTYVNYRPGETRACIGCHETSNDAPAAGSPAPSLAALMRGPSLPGPQPGERTGQRCLDYETDVQPILDRHCAECHNGKNEETGLDLRPNPTRIFNISYENLIGQKCSNDPTYHVQRSDLVGRLIREIRPKVGNAEYLPARSLGSTTSSLVALLDQGHYDVHLSREEMVRITTWIDSNCQYYGTYWGRKNIASRDHANFRRKVTFEQAISTNCSLPEDQR